MDDRELADLQGIDNWEFGAEARPPARPARAVVSVAFSRADLQRVTEAARH